MDLSTEEGRDFVHVWGSFIGGSMEVEGGEAMKRAVKLWAGIEDD